VDVIAPFAQVYLLGRGTGPLSFRSGRLAFGDALSAAFGRFLCKSHFLFLPLHTATVVRCAVSPTATALRLFSWGRASTGEVGTPTSDAPGCVAAVKLRVAEALAALALQRAFGAIYDSTDTRKPQSSMSDRTFYTSGRRATDTMKWGVGGQSLAGSGSRRTDRSCVTPYTLLSGILSPV